ncbi:MAG TPA: BON domain-containing protein [Pirellulales bacterium]|nr:BON domain-containing protein [Pirellulales bacterium]
MHRIQRPTLADRELQYRVALELLEQIKSRFSFLTSTAFGALRLQGRRRCVEIHAIDGEVRLVGRVESDGDKRAVEESAPRVAGVRQVIAHIQVDRAPNRRFQPTWN